MFCYYYSSSESSLLLDILKKPDKNIEEILDQEAVISEMKLGNQELINYFLEPDIFKKLIMYISKIPSSIDFEEQQQSNKDNKSNKYPYIACEILSIENDKMANYILGIKDHQNVHCKIEDNNNINHNLDDKNNIVDNNLPIETLFSFINTKDILNFTLAGYFAKVLRNLFYFRPKQLSDYIYAKKPEFLQKMIFHLYSDSIAEIFLIILRLDNQVFYEIHEKYHIEIRKNIINKLINNLNPYLSQQERTGDSSIDEEILFHIVQNSSMIICSLIQNRNYNAAEEILKPIMNLEILSILFSNLDLHKGISCESNSMHLIETNNRIFMGPIFQVLNVLCESFVDSTPTDTSSNGLIRHFRNLIDENENMDHDKILEMNTTFAQNGFTLENFSNHLVKILPELINLFNVFNNHTMISLLNNNISHTSKTEENIVKGENLTKYIISEDNALNQIISFQFGYQSKLFGQYRIKLIELTYSFLRLKDLRIYQKLADLSYFKILLELLIKIEWNDILHNLILKILCYAIESNSISLLKSLFEDANLLRYIIKSVDEPDYIIQSKLHTKVRRGYLAHIIKLANMIENSKNSYIKGYIEKNIDWLEYKENFLKKANENNNTKIGGYDPREMPSNFPGAFTLNNFNNIKLNLQLEPFNKSIDENDDNHINSMEIENTINNDDDIENIKEKDKFNIEETKIIDHKQYFLNKDNNDINQRMTNDKNSSNLDKGNSAQLNLKLKLLN